MPKHHQKEYVDIPFLLQQTPVHIQEKLIHYDMPSAPQDMIKDFLTKLQQTIKNQQPHETQSFNIYCLYHNYFSKIEERKIFPNGFPKPSEIEEKYEIEFNLSVHTLYHQLMLRSKFDRLKDSDHSREFLNCVEESWENYESIFTHQCTKIEFPPIVVWDLFEAFLHQLSQFSFRADSYSKDRLPENVFTLKATKQMLSKMTKNIPKVFNKNMKTTQLFGYYALLAQVTVEVYEGNYQKALDLISNLSLESILVYSRSFGALINLFLVISYSHFMLEEYNKSARLCEMILLFYQKNKKYLSNIEWLLMRQFEKLAGILCMSYIFLEEQPKSIIIEIFKNTLLKVKDKKEKERLLDKYYKLKQNDQQTFTKLFNHCCLPVLGTNRTLPEHHKLVLGRFLKLQSITLNSILRHYSQISIKKISELLNTSENEIKQQLNQYNAVNAVKTDQKDWDKTVMNPLLSQRKFINIEVTENNIVKLNESEKNEQNLDEEEWQQYREEVSWLVEKVEAL